MTASPEPRTRSLAGVSNADAVELLKENEKLVTYVLRRWFRGKYETVLTDDDLESIGRAALVKAWLNWRPELGAWSTIATVCIRRSLWRALKLERRDKTAPPIQFIATDPALLEDPAVEGDHEAVRSRVPRCEAAAAEDETLERLETEGRLRWIYEQLDRTDLLTRRQAKIVRFAMVGYNFSEISEIVSDCSRQYVTQEYNEALIKLRRAASAARLL